MIGWLRRKRDPQAEAIRKLAEHREANLRQLAASGFYAKSRASKLGHARRRNRERDSDTRRQAETVQLGSGHSPSGAGRDGIAQ